MKVAHEKAIARLLKDAGNREDAVGVNASGDHLDADELNSYAEGALPEAARARLTMHLADCRQCRQTVAALTTSAGVRGTQEIATQGASHNFWQKLGMLFSLPVLRYAVPALVLFVLIGITFIAFQQQRNSQFIAQRSPSTSPENPSPVKDDQPAEAGAVGSLSSRNETDQKLGANQKATTKSTAKENSSRSDIGTTQDRIVNSAPATVEPSFAPEPEAAPPAPKSEVIVSQEETAKEQDNAQAAALAKQSRDEDRSKDDRVKPGNVQNASPESRPQGLATLREAKRPGDKMRAEVGEESGTRTIAGRNFRRRGDAWVDTQYDSRPTVNIMRGSSNYNELVRSEPELRSIAEHLSGEVIVLWKGRAYRIR